ncbi:hypothetical protein HC028_08470 [Planosporangium flavigriseum]|uniref:Uncharacterized protein n=1 Tax=Planosporangium flavigriseum TaxID=373681 RepID=A0A8J3LRR0_9ACTN|nr:hypothetical protein [Planosporangium flavigriseum]NJC64538.1 hypothetical protein [Planosporangium flavigriseum]GIG71980.1 hypothetical protein Pfl04_03840 [Planosporangium flavigriseum]
MTQPDEDFQENTAAREELRPATEDIEAPPADAFEQTLPVHPEDLPERPNVRPDVSEADAIEQALLAVPSHHDDRPRIRPDVSEADALEQARTVEIPDDDY